MTPKSQQQTPAPRSIPRQRCDGLRASGDVHARDSTGVGCARWRPRQGRLQITLWSDGWSVCRRPAVGKLPHGSVQMLLSGTHPSSLRTLPRQCGCVLVPFLP
eukprot:652180-Rhodomonas_salina.2